jgi:hypothetical protein
LVNTLKYTVTVIILDWPELRWYKSVSYFHFHTWFNSPIWSTNNNNHDIIFWCYLSSSALRNCLNSSHLPLIGVSRLSRDSRWVSFSGRIYAVGGKQKAAASPTPPHVRALAHIQASKPLIGTWSNERPNEPIYRFKERLVIFYYYSSQCQCIKYSPLAPHGRVL